MRTTTRRTRGATLVIEPGLKVRVLNESWARPFVLEQKESRNKATFYLCRFTKPSPEGCGDGFDFDHFGVARVGGVVEAWPVIVKRGKKPSFEECVRKGTRVLESHRCLGCRALVNFRTSQRAAAAEVLQVTYTCPNCGHREFDVID